MLWISFLPFLRLVSLSLAQDELPPPPSTFPHFYPGIPNRYVNFQDSTAWQHYFLVKEKLPNATFPLQRSFAGNLPVNRIKHPNDTLFFWAWEKQNGSLTRSVKVNDDEPWVIWLNGGPGSSSMLGLLFENGPIHIAEDFSLVKNKFGWNTLADTIWIDQPVGVGFSTADQNGYISSEDQMGEDFIGFLSNLVRVFPSLAKRPLYLTGESYAGTYIPYITKAYFSIPNPPVRLAKIAIGDGSLGSNQVFIQFSILQVIETYPQLIDYDPDVYNYFKDQFHLCGYDVNITYPMKKPLPPPPPLMPLESNSSTFAAEQSRMALMMKKLKSALIYLSKETPAKWQLHAKRDLTGRAPKGKIDPWYECFLQQELADYTMNFTKPWSINDSDGSGFDFYDMPDALNPEIPLEGTFFMNDPSTRRALHAPISMNWSDGIEYPFQPEPGNWTPDDPSPEPMVFLSELASNSSKHNIKWVIYSGNDDFLVAHRGTEVTIQNTTFGGITGFTKKPSTAWFADDGQFAGIVHQERNITYLLFDKAGHLVPERQPERALTFLREFILGENRNGTVLSNGQVVGQPAPQLVNDILPGEHNPIFTGSGATMGSTIWPSATIAKWDHFISTATATASHVPRGSHDEV